MQTYGWKWKNEKKGNLKDNNQREVSLGKTLVTFSVPIYFKDFYRRLLLTVFL